MSSAFRLGTCKELLVMPVLKSWTGQENSINRAERRTEVIAGSFRWEVIFVHDVCSWSEFSKDLWWLASCLADAAFCTWMNFTYLRRHFAFWKDIFIQSFELKISIWSRIIDCFAVRRGDVPPGWQEGGSSPSSCPSGSGRLLGKRRGAGRLWLAVGFCSSAR